MKDAFNGVVALFESQAKLAKASEKAYYWIQRTQKDFMLEDDGTLEELGKALKSVNVDLLEE
jgi:hypothetical protein